MRYLKFCFLILFSVPSYWITSLNASCHQAISILETNIAENLALEIKPSAMQNLGTAFPNLHLNDLQDQLRDLMFTQYRFIEAIIQQIPTNRLSPYLFLEIPFAGQKFVLRIQRVALESLPDDTPLEYLYHRYKILNIFPVPESVPEDPNLKVLIKKAFNAPPKDDLYISKGPQKTWPPIQIIPFQRSGTFQRKVLISTDTQTMISFVDAEEIKKGRSFKTRTILHVFLPLPYIVKPGVLDQILRKHQIDLSLFKRIMASWDHSLADDSTELGRRRHYKYATVHLDGIDYRIFFHLGATEKIPAVVTVIPE